MSQLNNSLLLAAQVVRKAAQEISDEGLLPYFSPYPKGWCGCASRVLGVWLLHCYPEYKFYYVCGRRGRSFHAWIENEGTIIDITADQFPGFTEQVCIITREQSTLHRRFRTDFTRLCDPSDIDYYEEGLIYKRISQIDSKKHLYNC